MHERRNGSGDLRPDRLKVVMECSATPVTGAPLHRTAYNGVTKRVKDLNSMIKL